MAATVAVLKSNPTTAAATSGRRPLRRKWSKSIYFLLISFLCSWSTNFFQFNFLSTQYLGCLLIRPFFVPFISLPFIFYCSLALSASASPRRQFECTLSPQFPFSRLPFRWNVNCVHFLLADWPTFSRRKELENKQEKINFPLLGRGMNERPNNCTSSHRLLKEENTFSAIHKYHK